MASDGNSFLPTILSVFYAVFHDKGGTNIVYQVPEDLILTSPTQALGTNLSASTSGLRSSESDAQTLASVSSIGKDSKSGGGGEDSVNPSRASSVSRYSHLASSRETLGSSANRALAHNRFLFKFEDISRYVIPPRALCGRLVTCTTRRHQIIGFPVELENRKRYERNFFRYNVCFVFERTADLSCYEPIVRKIGRVLTTCEEESCFLTSPETSHKIHAILEQLYEDLNSYSETSIPIDKFNSIELKIFPFYPNPPEVHDWSVPIALINLKKRIEANWDLTMAKICSHIDGTNHVSRIAYLADCDLDLTRKAIQHLLFYQVIMMIDIFQFSNMYTLCRSVSWLADEAHVRDECGPYVTKPDHDISEWPDLLHLYSRLKPGLTVFDWMHEYDTDKHGIDPRRFVSFGVIKGFLRRVHRWPVLLASPGQEKNIERRPSSTFRKRGKSLNLTSPPTFPVMSPTGSGVTSPPVLTETSVFFPRNIASTTPPGPPSVFSSAGLRRHGSQSQRDRDKGDRGEGERERTFSTPARRASNAKEYLEQFKREKVDSNPTPPPGGLMNSASVVMGAINTNIQTSPRTQRYRSRRGSYISPVAGPGAGGVTAGIGLAGLTHSTSTIANDYSMNSLDGLPSGTSLTNPSRPRLSRSPSSQNIMLPGAQMTGGIGPTAVVPAELKDLLDGTRHTDELGTKFEVGWPVLEEYLVAIGGGKGDGDFGKIEIIYR